jgi:type IV secretory pathway protease TraF
MTELNKEKLTIEKAWRYAIAPDAPRVPSPCTSHSFDSRYFGPVPTSAIRDRLRPLVIF